MPCYRALAVLLLAAGLSAAAELKTVKGDSVKGDVVRVDGKTVVLKVGDKEETFALTDVISLDLGTPAALPQSRYSQVELVDGTQLYCKQVLIKGKKVEMTLLNDQKASVGITSIAWLLNDANDQNRREEWKKVLAKKSVTDLLVVTFGENKGVHSLPVPLGEGSEDGTQIDYTRDEDKKVAAIDKAVGLFFSQRADPTAAPVVCKVLDTDHNVVFASEVTLNEGGYTVVTPAGAKIVYKPTQLANLDYRRGKLTYLSELDPTQVLQDSTEDVVYSFQRDKNIEGGGLRIEGKKFEKGLALHSHTELVYALGGEYRQFKAVVGFDDQIGGSDGKVILKVEGDGRTLATLTLTRKDKQRTQALNLNVKDVEKLRITVTSGDLLDYGKHLDLADAQVSK